MYRNILKFTLAVASCLGIVSCDIGDDAQICDYNLQLNYHYNKENTETRNVITDYVSSISEYIFDANGVLYAVNNVSQDICDGTLRSELTLPAGNYSVVAWGNLESTCAVNDARIGVTRREDMLLTLDNLITRAAAFHDNSDRLYYAYRTFAVAPTGITRKRVDAVHSHLVLGVEITWHIDPPAGDGEFQLQLSDVPSEYGFMPEYIHYNSACHTHSEPLHDEYNKENQETKQYITYVHQDRNILKHRVSPMLRAENKMTDTFVAFRMRDVTNATLRFVFLEDNGSGYTEVPLMDDIKLGDDFFVPASITLDRLLKQEYLIKIDIYETGVVITPGDAGDLDGSDGNGNSGGGDLNGSDGNGSGGTGGGDLNGSDGSGNSGGGDLNGSDGSGSGGNAGGIGNGGNL